MIWYCLALFLLIMISIPLAYALKAAVLLICMFFTRKERNKNLNAFDPDMELRRLSVEERAYYDQANELNKSIVLAKQYAYGRRRIPIGTPIHVDDEEEINIKLVEIQFMIEAIHFQRTQLELMYFPHLRPFENVPGKPIFYTYNDLKHKY